MPTDQPKPFEIRQSPMQGLGAFATRPILAGIRLIEYAGQRLTPAEADARYPDVEGERHHTVLFAIDDEIVIDAYAVFGGINVKVPAGVEVIDRTFAIFGGTSVKRTTPGTRRIIVKGLAAFGGIDVKGPHTT